MTTTSMGASRRTLLLGAAGAGLALPYTAFGQGQYRAEYKLSVVGNRPIPLSAGAFDWADLVTQRSGGRINVKVYPGSQLVGGDQTRELVAMRQGIIDMAVFSTINISPQVREMNLFSLPFLLRDHRGFDAIINGEVGQDLFRVLATREVVPVAWGENGFRELVEFQACRPQAGRPARHEDPLRRRRHLQRDLHRPRRQPAADVLRRPAAGAVDRRGRWAGEPGQPVPRLPHGHAGAEIPDHLELRRRCAESSSSRSR